MYFHYLHCLGFVRNIGNLLPSSDFSVAKQFAVWPTVKWSYWLPTVIFLTPIIIYKPPVLLSFPSVTTPPHNGSWRSRRGNHGPSTSHLSADVAVNLHHRSTFIFIQLKPFRKSFCSKRRRMNVFCPFWSYFVKLLKRHILTLFLASKEKKDWNKEEKREHETKPERAASVVSSRFSDLSSSQLPYL